MPSRELVSVLIPAFNHERYVRECLVAIAAQTHRPLELLIADDASTDTTADVITAFLARHGAEFERVVFHRHDANVGVADTLNRLLVQARGTYIFLNASDDRASPRAIATLVDVLDNDRRAALAVGDSVIIDGSGARVYWGPNRETVNEEHTATYRTWVDYLRDVNRHGVFDPRLFGRIGTLHRVNYLPNGKLFRRTAVIQAGGWQPGTFEDWVMNFRLARRHRLRYVDEVLFAYRWHDTNTVHDPQRAPMLQNATKQVIARELRNPIVWARVLARRDLQSRVRNWAKSLQR